MPLLSPPPVLPCGPYRTNGTFRTENSRPLRTKECSRKGHDHAVSKVAPPMQVPNGYAPRIMELLDQSVTRWLISLKIVFDAIPPLPASMSLVEVPATTRWKRVKSVARQSNASDESSSCTRSIRDPEFLPFLANGIMFADVIAVLTKRRVPDINRAPATLAAARRNVTAVLQTIRSDPALSPVVPEVYAPSPFAAPTPHSTSSGALTPNDTLKGSVKLAFEDVVSSILQSDLAVILPLLEDLHRAADGIAPRSRAARHDDVPYLVTAADGGVDALTAEVETAIADVCPWLRTQPSRSQVPCAEVQSTPVRAPSRSPAPLFDSRRTPSPHMAAALAASAASPIDVSPLTAERCLESPTPSIPIPTFTSPPKPEPAPSPLPPRPSTRGPSERTAPSTPPTEIPEETASIGRVGETLAAWARSHGVSSYALGCAAGQPQCGCWAVLWADGVLGAQLVNRLEHRHVIRTQCPSVSTALGASEAPPHARRLMACGGCAMRVAEGAELHEIGCRHAAPRTILAGTAAARRNGIARVVEHLRARRVAHTERDLFLEEAIAAADSAAVRRLLALLRKSFAHVAPTAPVASAAPSVTTTTPPAPAPPTAAGTTPAGSTKVAPSASSSSTATAPSSSCVASSNSERLGRFVEPASQRPPLPRAPPASDDAPASPPYRVLSECDVNSSSATALLRQLGKGSLPSRNAREWEAEMY